MDYCLQVNNINKVYNGAKAVNNVSFKVKKGSIFGLLGPNGAGKTSLIRIITTITAPDSGTVLVDGIGANIDTPTQIGYLPEERGLYKKMKVKAQMLYLAQLKGLTKKEALFRINFWLDKFDIQSWSDKKVEELSKGMQQKVQFISTILHKPSLLILDEPFSGLDPINTNLMKSEIIELCKQGVSIIFSTHRMEQVEEICEEIVILNKGNIILNGNVKSIKNQFKENKYSIKYEGDFIYNPIDQTNLVKHDNNELIVQIDDKIKINDLLKEIIDQGITIIKFEEILPTLNEIFIKKIGATNE